MRAATLSLAALALLVSAPPLCAQQWQGLMLEGIADGEMWATDPSSTVLSRDDGHAAPAGRLQLFGGLDARRLQLIAMGELEGGNGSAEGKTEWGYDQLMVRVLASPYATLDAGKFPSPLGAFANRRLSTMNPLIGTPDGYPVRYPWGMVLNGAGFRVDYRVGVMSLPATHEDYAPDPTPRLRPVLGAGVTPIPEVRIGASVTWGPYLNDTLGAVLPAGADWKDYSQRVIAFDSRVSRGYTEVHAELALSRYDVPTRPTPIDGVTYYAEAKQTWNPRLFSAVRFERNDYPFILPITASQWIAQRADGYNVELGLGVRPDARSLVKVSYRRLWWNIDPSLRARLPDGYAVALQLSLHFDVRDWLDRKQ